MAASATDKAVAGTADFLDERLGLSKVVKGAARKVFPDHWSFMLGEVALYSFIILLLSGTFLTLWYVPSMALTEYQGAYRPLNGVEMSEAFASTLAISFDVRGGLLMRQVHHWSALLFIAAMAVHMFRVFFTGAFRRPREINWILGAVLALMGLGAGFSGYSLPDDLLSGNGLRIIDGVVKSIPVVGTYVSFFLFGGEFPGESIIPRLFIIHVLLIPGLILALIGAHLGLVVAAQAHPVPRPGPHERATSSGTRCCRCTWPRRAASSSSSSASSRSCRRWCRSTRSGTTVPTTPPPSRPVPSPTGTSGGSTARCG